MKRGYWIRTGEFEYRPATRKEIDDEIVNWYLIEPMPHKHLARRYFEGEDTCFLCVLCRYKETIPKRVKTYEKKNRA